MYVKKEKGFKLVIFPPEVIRIFLSDSVTLRKKNFKPELENILNKPGSVYLAPGDPSFSENCLNTQGKAPWPLPVLEWLSESIVIKSTDGQ